MFVRVSPGTAFEAKDEIKADVLGPDELELLPGTLDRQDEGMRR